MSSSTILFEQTGQLTLKETQQSPLLRRGEGNDIKEAFEAAQTAEGDYLKCVKETAVLRGMTLDSLFDGFRLRAEKILDDKTPTESLPLSEQQSLDAAINAVKAWRGLRDAVYLTVAADRGHGGRAQLALLRNSLGNSLAVPLKNGKQMKVTFKNTLKAHGFKQIFLNRSKKLLERRAVPDVPSDCVIAVHVLHKDRRVSCKYEASKTILELKTIIGESQEVSPDRIKITLGNRDLGDEYTLTQWSIQPGTVLIFDVLPMPKVELEEEESSDSDQGDDV